MFPIIRSTGVVCNEPLPHLGMTANLVAAAIVRKFFLAFCRKASLLFGMNLATGPRAALDSPHPVLSNGPQLRVAFANSKFAQGLGHVWVWEEKENDVQTRGCGILA